MRILRVAQTIYPDVKGGGAYHVHAMSRDQAAMGHDVTVLTVRHDPELPHIEERDGYTVVRYDPTVNLLGNDISLGVAQYLRDAANFDVIHAHSHLYFSTNLAALKRFCEDIPLAITNHGLYSQTAPEWVFDLYLRTMGRWTFNQADVVFCYTETDKERVRGFGVSSQIEVVPNGIDTERFMPEGPESDLVEADGPIVLFVGRLVEGKQPSIALEGFASVRKEYPNAEMYLCGEGPLQETLESQAADLGIEDSVTFLGQVPYDEMPNVFRSVDLFVLSSRAEGVPRTIMEALSTGIPVVCSELPQVKSAFGNEIAYAPVDNVDVFGDRMRETLMKESNAELDSEFSWERTVKQTTASLNRLNRK
ncbi:glycosyltransferase family 4 protein [Halopiger aswanensis]|uniref:Glycosyltransferase involved in cell wall biosynthesis n=1 Tax=Halopiger aswanensis TaxID=148449 RepID=A0A419WRN9_9EURY|nr:glycosyltransferase family 4 protein [Halopiger aswanensis]RKD98087.1 glycosyltransferase involved in cell wall biosynthesis [Halopiger aswanensis]